MTQALEICRIRVSPERAGALRVGREEALAALRAECPGMVAAHLARVAEDHREDVVLWRSPPDAPAAMDRAPSIPTFARWCENISEVISMQHAEVRSGTHA